MDRRNFLNKTIKTLTALNLASQYRVSADEGESKNRKWEIAPGTKVPTRKLGKTDIETPILIMGCCQNIDPVYDRRLHRAYELGVNHLDTAQMYAEGQSHKTIAPFIKQIGDRKKLIIASKVHQTEDKATPEKFVENINLSLQELETDYLDIFYMHIVKHERFLDKEFIEMGDKLKKEGKIRYFGFSAHHGNAHELMMKASKLGGGIDVIMFKYSFREMGKDNLNRAIDACKEAGIGLVAIKTLGSIPDDGEELLPWTSKNFTTIQAKLKAVWEDERIAGIASQMGNIQHVHENAYAAITPMKLTELEKQELRYIAEKTQHLYCAGCNHHCENGMDTPLYVQDVWRCLLYAKGYGDERWARYCYRDIEKYIEKLSMEQLIMAKEQCPYHIDIPGLFYSARKILG
ncbi:MAG TPA: aldo/keto reductase [Candidatus Hydrogenedens sp.]|nr:aldo/keto reductase [Candidatus Hydrogenedens sp.]HOK09302.1 aldo/keto reductase [Candidatus Hydrogenedens sp.]HOL21142.1 aldo/keto reductase [Candidatus Hydrogenedens sp.]HPP59811.1 aldo/keto reductase [Candidatus Hydrogenedens sp.]